jgi:hypothetical protein
MADKISDELRAEIEAFQAELRVRAEQHEQAMQLPSALDLPPLDTANLDMPQIRALISQRYEQVRFDKRLRELEGRIAEIESRNG